MEQSQAGEESGASRQATEPRAVAPAAPPANLYVFSVFLLSGPISEKFANKEISRVIEIRGDQTLEQLHHAIFKAYDRWDEHLYEFQFGKRPFDPDGPNYGVPRSGSEEERGWRRTHDKAGRPGSEAGSCLRLLVRLRRQLVSSGSGGPDRASHPDRHLPARHQASGQISAAVLRRIVAAKCGNDVKLEAESRRGQSAEAGRDATVPGFTSCRLRYELVNRETRK